MPPYVQDVNRSRHRMMRREIRRASQPVVAPRNAVNYGWPSVVSRTAARRAYTGSRDQRSAQGTASSVVPTRASAIRRSANRVLVPVLPDRAMSPTAPTAPVGCGVRTDANWGRELSRGRYHRVFVALRPVVEALIRPEMAQSQKRSWLRLRASSAPVIAGCGYFVIER